MLIKWKMHLDQQIITAHFNNNPNYIKNRYWTDNKLLAMAIDTETNQFYINNSETEHAGMHPTKKLRRITN